MYARALLLRMDCPDSFDAWIQQLVHVGVGAAGPGAGAYPEVGRMFATLLAMVQASEPFQLPKTRRGSSIVQWCVPATGEADETLVRDDTAKPRKILMTHPKELTFALRKAINSASPGGFLLDRGHFQRYAAFKQLEVLLGKRAAEASAATGDEATQRREIVLYDYEQDALFVSILSEAYALQQTGGFASKRKPIDTLTLGVITAMYFALGARGLNLDTTQHGFLSITRWQTDIWPKVRPLVLRLRNSSKGETANSAKQMQELLHHRDPMRWASCLIPP